MTLTRASENSTVVSVDARTCWDKQVTLRQVDDTVDDCRRIKLSAVNKASEYVIKKASTCWNANVSMKISAARRTLNFVGRCFNSARNG